MLYLRSALMFLMAVISFNVNAGPLKISIDFESFPGPDGILGTLDDVRAADTFLSVITNEYESLGLNFQVGTLFQFARGGNHLLYGTWPIATFSVPVNELYIDNYSGWNVFLTGYDSSGNVVATDFSSAEIGYRKSQLTLFSNIPISTFTLVSDGDRGRIISFDNLTYIVTQNVTKLSEPSTNLVTLIALAAFVFVSRKLKRKNRS